MVRSWPSCSARILQTLQQLPTTRIMDNGGVVVLNAPLGILGAGVGRFVFRPALAKLRGAAGRLTEGLPFNRLRALVDDCWQISGEICARKILTVRARRICRHCPRTTPAKCRGQSPRESSSKCRCVIWAATQKSPQRVPGRHRRRVRRVRRARCTIAAAVEGTWRGGECAWHGRKAPPRPPVGGKGTAGGPRSLC